LYFIKTCSGLTNQQKAKPEKPWMSYDCLKMGQAIRSLGKRLQKDPTNTFLRHTYSIHVKQYNRLKKSLKSAFYKTFIDKINTLDHKERKS
jgi:hypothetical protein